MVRSIGFDVVPCLVAWDGNGSLWPILLQKSAGSVGAISFKILHMPLKKHLAIHSTGRSAGGA
jgi:hypothetical protein